MAAKRTADPIVPIEAFNQAKAVVREAGDAFDGEILQTLADAIVWVQDELNRQLITTTWEASFDSFPDDAEEEMVLMPSPLVSVASITYTDDDGAQTWNSADYDVFTTSEPGWVRPAYEEEYPSTAGLRDVVVSYSAGYGTSWSSVPEIVRRQVLMRFEELYKRVELPESMAVRHNNDPGDEFHVYP